ncbi:SufE family protein [Muribaculum intestinale]|uniref:Fe-S metabolism protein SufE n=1 Tax=Muribaculum intestinale TaxID=1796646 RepID=A0A1B1SAT6_9BACT|nr:SufE family protein [Muribaculum intestinale]GFI67645.1 cysteine desulfuration protein SufE [Muribaculaceae bacterium]ANU63914.1 Fe-S metabolism protein SufE [Muribaculum intestinale]ASB37994.1 Fe-S metabolism protein SufE [Muribaculum intestinale]MYM11723.1 SufE family protein [Muribaculum intestinale]PWB04822.1 SufE family protein [Muribaculum intestinale]
MTINEIQDEIIEEFADIDDWMDRYAYIIDMGNTLPPMPEEYKTPQYIIEGCQSRAWLHADITPEGLIHFTADSDAIIVKGIISMLLKVLNDHSPAEIADADLYFIDKIGLAENLSPTRSNGLAALVKQMKLYAIAYKAKLENEGK